VLDVKSASAKSEMLEEEKQIIMKSDEVVIKQPIASNLSDDELSMSVDIPEIPDEEVTASKHAAFLEGSENANPRMN